MSQRLKYNPLTNQFDITESVTNLTDLTASIHSSVTATKAYMLVGDGTVFRALTSGREGDVLTMDSSGPSGIKWAAASAGGYSTIQDEGGALTQRSTLNFAGSLITGADSGGLTLVNVGKDANGSDLFTLANGLVTINSHLTLSGYMAFNNVVPFGSQANAIGLDGTTTISTRVNSAIVQSVNTSGVFVIGTINLSDTGTIPPAGIKGLYGDGLNTIAVGTNAIQAAKFNVSGVFAPGLYGNVFLNDGLVGTPSLAFFNDQDTGIYWAAANQLGFAVGGGIGAVFNTEALVMGRNAISSSTGSLLEIYGSTVGTSTPVFRQYAPGGPLPGKVYWLTNSGASAFFEFDTNQNLQIKCSGVTMAKIDRASSIGETGLWIYDVDNAALERVSVGASDSGGTGKKVLCIPN